MKTGDVLLCVFSFNMGVTLDNCLNYIGELCAGFDTILVDDASNDPITLQVIEGHAERLKGIFVNRTPKEGKKHGNLYSNIQKAIDFATEHEYRYLFMVQDDTQFVRPLNDDVMLRYQATFDADASILEVDPRFLRAGKFEVLRDVNGYRNSAGMSWADVGIIDLQRFQQSGWRLQEGERANRNGLADLGYRRVFAGTPVMMHVPFPQRYRKGKLKGSLLVRNRGKYGYHRMTDEQIAAMDARDLSQPPFFRKYLKVRNMVLSRVVYHLSKDMRVFV